MSASDFVLRDLELADLPALAAFAPDEWRMALDAVLLRHVGHSYFHARVAVDATGLAATAQGIVTGSSAWLGNIIVAPRARNRGLGARMTLDLLEVLRARGCARFLLVATELGEPVYRKIGFRKTAEYVFLKVPRLPLAATRAVRRLEPEDTEELLHLDFAAKGEEREALLAAHLGTGWGHLALDGRLDGFFLPSFGAGLVVARDATAGCELLQLKHSLYPLDAVVPADNATALRLLTEQGARETLRAPRMSLGEEVAWRPQWIFARGTGYCG